MSLLHTVLPAAVLTALLATTGLSGSAMAQTISVESLDDAKAFAPGIEVEGALAAESWQGTSAERAVRLLRDMITDTPHPVVQVMQRRVVLSGIMPPDGAGEAFERLRIRAAQRLSTPDEYARFAARNASSQAPALRAEAYLAQGDLAAACEISDTIVQGRSESDWVRLRAACHDSRGETAAADLARDLLRDRGEPTQIVIADPPEGFWLEMMALDQAALMTFMAARADYPETPLSEPVPEADLEPESEPDLDPDPDPDPGSELEGSAPLDLLAPQREDDRVDAIPPAQSVTDLPSPDPTRPNPAILSEPVLPEPILAEPILGEPFDLADAQTDPTQRGTARLFELGRKGDAAAVAAFVKRASAAGLDPDRVLSRIPAILDPTQMAAVDLPLFARHAVATRDIPMMQALYIATDDETGRERLALASDALGNGYIGRPLGDGLETALTAGREGAVRDVMLALGLGAVLEEAVEARLVDTLTHPSSSAAWIGIDQTIDRGAPAELLLRLAAELTADTPPDAWTLYKSLRALRGAGFSDLAGQLAAYEYLRGIDADLSKGQDTGRSE